MRTAQRIANLPPYLFAEIDRKKAIKTRSGHRRHLARHRRSRHAHARAHRRTPWPRRSTNPANHQYPSYVGAPRYREACSRVDEAPLRRRRRPRRPRRSRSSAARRASRTSSSPSSTPATYTLVPGAGYPVYHTGGILVGGETYWMPMTEENGFLADFESTPPDVLAKRQDDVPQLPEQPDLGDRERRVLRPRHRVRQGARPAASSTTTPTPRSASTATSRRASSSARAPRTSPSSCSAARRRTT